MTTLNFYNKLHQLPSHIQKEVNDFIEFLSLKYSKSPKKKIEKKSFRFDWEGGLRNSKATSVELQHKANEWRNSCLHFKSIVVLFIVFFYSLPNVSGQNNYFYIPKQKNATESSADKESSEYDVEKAYEAYNSGDLVKTIRKSRMEKCKLLLSIGQVEL